MVPMAVAGWCPPTQETPVVKRSKGRRSSHTLRLWTFDDAQAAVPYIASVVRSLREHHLDILTKRRELQALADSPGRLDRKALIAEQETRRDLTRSEQEYQSAL